MTISKLPKNKREYAAALKRAEAASIRRIASYLHRPGRQRSAEEIQEDLEVFAKSREDDADHAERHACPNLSEMIAEVFR